MTERSRQEITSMVLQSAEKGATKTTLMYQAYLSQDALDGYLTLLLEKKLIEYLAGEMKFKTTAKGLTLLSSKTEVRVKACDHQCKKCGVLYCCKQTDCQNPFHHAVCNQCLRFLGRHDTDNAVHNILDTISLAKTRPTIADI